MRHITMPGIPPMCQSLAEEIAGLTLSTASAPLARTATLHIGLVNLMPTKEVTERQWLRLLAMMTHGGDLKLSLLKLPNWQPRHVSPLHMAQYYQDLPFGPALNQYDAIIVTGAPLGKVPYTDVLYWQTLTAFITQLRICKIPTLYSCWAAQAALFHHHAIATLRKPDKLSGVFAQKLCTPSFKQGRAAQIIAAIAQQNLTLAVPQSRYALPQPNVLQLQLDDPRQPLQGILSGDATGTTCVFDEASGDLMLLGHPEYEVDTLALEYQRDSSQHPDTPQPSGYDVHTPVNNLAKSAQWQALGASLLSAWLNATTAKRSPVLVPHQQ